jgi:transcription elongation factor S-II
MDNLPQFNNFDDKFRLSLVQFLNKELNEINLCRKIEKSIYNYCIKISKDKCIKQCWNNHIFKNLYLSKIRSIYSNIKEDSYIQNKTFRNKIISGKIDPNKIATLSSYDIFPEVWKELIDLKIKRDKLKYELKPEAMTDVFKCRKCSSRSCSYYEVQTRSADEPMTQFINCLECGNRWRQ